MAGSECTLKLELGKVYEVQVRARNYIGESPWCARVAAPVSSPGTPPAGYTLFATSGKHINRLRIKYDLNGGDLTLNPAPAPSPTMPIKNQYIVYDSYDSAAPKTLLAISTASPPSGNTLTKTIAGTPPTPPLNFITWLDSNTGLAPTVPYTYKNVYVTADFGAGLEGTVTVPTLTDMPSNAVTIKYADNTGAHGGTSTAHATTHHHEIPKYVAANTVTWITVEFASLSPPPADTYSDMECSIYFANGSGAYSKIDLTPAPDGKSCTFSTGLYAPQTFTLSVKAKNQHGATLGKTYLIDLY